MLLNTPLPLVAAPMAGGVTTPALVAAAMRAGAMGFLAAGYLPPAALADAIATVRAEGDRFGVNLFVPDTTGIAPEAYRAYRNRLLAEAPEEMLAPEAVEDDDHWEAKLDLLRTDPVPMVSFTFGLPSASIVAQLRRAGSLTLASVTTVDEGRAAQSCGIDALIVQGPAAGGHSAVHDPAGHPSDLDLADLVGSLRAAVPLPVIAAGGVDGPDAVSRLLAAGAQAVAVGTLLLDAEEAGTNAVHRAALHDARFTSTAITRAFTGRPARGLVNDFLQRHTAVAPVGYPAVHHLTRPLRTAAVAAGNPQGVHLWAGTGWRAARHAPTAEILGALVR